MILRARCARRAGLTLLLVVGIAGCATTVEEPSPPPVQTSVPPPAVRAKPTTAPAPPPAPRVEAEAPPEPQRPPVVVSRPNDVDGLIAEFQRLRRLPAADVAREQEAARQAFAQARTDTTRMRYAMTLALPGMPPADDGRALEMLEPVVRNGASALNGLAVLLASYIQEQRRLGAQVQALQQKLEALRALERNLTERRR
jgi:type IV secretory pathway VirB10-like protein